jgi:signal transduction histidine kinase
LEVAGQQIRGFHAVYPAGIAAPGDPLFPQLVSLACHDLRTPLATIFGFARTLTRMDELAETPMQYAEMIEAASQQMAELLDELSLAARIQSGRYEPSLAEVDTAELAQAAAERLGEERVGVSGSGGTVRVDRDATARAVSSLVRCALRHGGVERVDVVADGATLTVAPITPASAPVVLGQDLRDLGAAVAVLVIERLGGSVAVDERTLTVRLPTEAVATTAGP